MSHGEGCLNACGQSAQALNARALLLHTYLIAPVVLQQVQLLASSWVDLAEKSLSFPGSMPHVARMFCQQQQEQQEQQYTKTHKQPCERSARHTPG